MLKANDGEETLQSDEWSSLEADLNKIGDFVISTWKYWLKYDQTWLSDTLSNCVQLNLKE